MSSQFFLLSVFSFGITGNLMNSYDTRFKRFFVFRWALELTFFWEKMVAMVREKAFDVDVVVGSTSSQYFAKHLYSCSTRMRISHVFDELCWYALQDLWIASEGFPYLDREDNAEDVHFSIFWDWDDLFLSPRYRGYDITKMLLSRNCNRSPVLAALLQTESLFSCQKNRMWAWYEPEYFMAQKER